MARTLSLAIAVTIFLGGCTKTPDQTFASSCHEMAKHTEYLRKGERKPFCSCLVEKSAQLSDAEKLAMSEVMANYSPDSSLRASAQTALEGGVMTFDSLKQYFEGLTNCAAVHIG